MFSMFSMALAVVLTGAAVLGSARPAAAQSTDRPPAFVAVRADTVVLHLTEAPSVYGGFVVYRGAPGAELERITDEPVRPVRRPAAARVLIGGAWDDVLRAARATDGAELLRRLRAEEFTGSVLSGLYPGVARVLGRRFEDPGRAPGAELEYRVVYVDAAGEETDRAFTVSVQAEARVPSPPTDLEAETDDGAARITWRYPAFDGNARDVVIGFHVYRADGADDEFRRLTSAPVLRERRGASEFVDDGLTHGIAYRYRVRAVDLLGREGEPGETVEVRPTDETAPARPREVRAQPGDGEVLLVWRAAPEPDVAGYHVERATGRNSGYERLTEGPVPALDPAWNDTTAVGGTQYFYRVIAVDRVGNASEPSNPWSVVPNDHTPPAAPSGVEAEVADRMIQLRWRPSPSEDVRGYYISRGATGGGLARITHEPVPDTAFVDTGFGGEGLNPGDRYRVAVVAVDHAANRSDSVLVEVAVPDDEPPGPPTGVTARNVEGRYAQLSWTVSPSRDVERYVLARTALDEPAGSPAPGADDEAAGAAVEVGEFAAAGPRAVRDSAVEHGGRYVYALTAVDAAGNRSGATVDTLTVRRPTPPPPPRHTTATVTEAGTEITWERVIDDELVGYHVYRATLPTGVYERLTDAPLAERRFVDPAGRAEHYYVVRAVDRSGNESDAGPATSPEGG